MRWYYYVKIRKGCWLCIRQHVQHLPKQQNIKQSSQALVNVCRCVTKPMIYDSPRAVAAGRAARQRVRSVRIFSSLCEPVIWGLLSGLAWLSFSQLPVSDHCVADGLKDISLGGIARQLASHGWQESHQEGEEGCEKLVSRLVTRKSNKSPESPIICFLEPEPSKCPLQNCQHMDSCSLPLLSRVSTWMFQPGRWKDCAWGRGGERITQSGTKGFA